MKFKYISFVIAIGLFGCAEQKKSVETVNVSHRVISNDQLLLATPMSLIYAADRVFGIDRNSQNPFFYINPNDATDFRTFGAKGQGPDEFLYPTTLQYIGPNKIMCFNAYPSSVIELDIDEIIKGDKFRKTNEINLENIVGYSLATNYNQYVGMGLYDDCMIMLYDSTGRISGRFFEFPNKDEKEQLVSNRVKFMAYQGPFVTNPSKTKVVYAVTSADIIHFYDVSADDIKIIKKHEGSYPDYTPYEEGTSVGATQNATSNLWYISAAATDQFVYLLYSGRSVAQHPMSFWSSEEVHVYDWDGNMVKKYKLDAPCTTLCVSPDDKKLWATANLPDPVIIECLLL